MGWGSEKKESKQVTIEADFELGAYTVTWINTGVVANNSRPLGTGTACCW
jgi:hypothetical protein